MDKVSTQKTKPWFHNFIVKILTAGRVPQHVAIIMDGNRRFADKKHFDRSAGHLKGFEKLAEILELCMDLGVTEVTVYAFSIENFKRSKEEVDCLMELARQKFTSLLKEGDLVDKHCLKIRILGNISLLPNDIQRLFAEGVYTSRHNNRAFLNICFAYTSREEMSHAIHQISEGVSLGFIKPCDIDENLFSNCLYTRGLKNPDLLIRTSGEIRLSDFLLWQSAFSMLTFLSVLWPEISRWHLYLAIILFQICIPYHDEKLKEYTSIAKISATSQSDLSSNEQSERLQRIKQFYKYLDDKEEIFLNNLKNS